MKKKIWMILFGVLLLIFIGGFSFSIYQNNQRIEKENILLKKQQEAKEKVNKINEKLAYVLDNSISNNNCEDKICIYFNELILKHSQINAIESKKNVTISSIKNLNKLEQEINDKKLEIKNINRKIEDINLVIKDFSIDEQKAILKIYNEYEGMTINDDLTVNNYLKTLDDSLDLITFLKNNQSEYFIDNNTIFYKSDSFKTKIDKYNTDLKLEKFIDNGKKIPILMYHGVLDKAWGDTSLFVKVSEFESQMKYLSENGYTTLFVSEINSAKNYEKPIIITFDDGYKDVYDYAYPILKKYNFKADVYVISGWLDGQTYMNSNMVKELSNSGVFEIGSHTVTHATLGALDSNSIEKEVSDSKTALENIIGKKINSIAYPKGSYGSKVINISKKYYTYGLTTVNDFNYSDNYSKMTLKRIKIFRGMNITTFASKL